MFLHTLMSVDLAWEKKLIKNIVENANVVDSNSQKELFSLRCELPMES